MKGELMAINKIDNNKYKITIELGYDILGNRKRKTFIRKKSIGHRFCNDRQKSSL